jgi:hypothetical protein
VSGGVGHTPEPETPLPWAVAGDRLYSKAGGMTRGIATGMRTRDAEFAALASNNFAGLLEALEPFGQLGWVGELPDDHEFAGGYTVGDLRRVRAAIAKARGAA